MKTRSRNLTGSNFSPTLARLPSSALVGAAVSVKVATVFMALSLVGVPMRAELVSHEMASESQFSEWIWKDDGLAPRSVLPKLEPLMTLKQFQMRGQHSKCADAAAKQRNKQKIIESWIFALELSCRLADVANNEKAFPSLETAVKTLEAHSQWMLWGPQAETLKNSWKVANLKLLEWKIKKDPRRGWDFSDRLLKTRGWLASSEKAVLFRSIADLAFREQKVDAARQYYRLSLQEADDEEVRQKLLTLDNSGALANSAGATSGASGSNNGGNLNGKIGSKSPGTDATEKAPAPNSEAEIYSRMNQALKAGEYIAAVEDGVKLLREFPGGKQAKWSADRIYEIFVTVSEKEGAAFATLKRRVLDLMKSTDGTRQSKWAGSAFRSGFFDEAGELAASAHDKLKTAAPSVKMLEMAAYTDYLTGRYKEAKSRYQEILEKHAGSEEAPTAEFMLGLLSLKQSAWPDALAHFERLRAGSLSSTMDVKVRYWYWRALEKIDVARGQAEAQALSTRYPLSYYGLRARAETSDGLISLYGSAQPAPAKGTLWTAADKEFWKRLDTLLRAGWIEEAQAELADHADWVEPRDLALSAQLWAAAFQYPKVISIFNRVWEKEVSLLHPVFLKMAFPQLFHGPLEEQAQQWKIDPRLVRSLMRQESAFAPKAVSTSGALGLMQMIPATAKETAQSLNFKNLKLPEDLFQPKTNIRFCTYYLSKMVTEFDGNVPAALAAYNSGPSRLKRWMKARKLELKNSSDPLDEMWFDELPWEETQFYVKAILRNLIVYRVLDRGPVKMASPIWASN